MNVDELPERLQSKIEVQDDGCWLWMSPLTAKGYAYSRFEGRMRRIHRVTYELLVGDIPEGLTIDHLCRVRRCVNPEHLEPVTNRENILRGVSPPALNIVKTHCKYGHEFTPENTYVSTEHPGDRNCRACAIRRATRSNQERRRRQVAS